MGSIRSIFGSLFPRPPEPEGTPPPVDSKMDAAPPDAPAVPPEDEQDPLKPMGTIGGWYDIYRCIGRGGFGVVYLGVLRETREVVALKTFRDEFLVSSAARKAFKKEALLWVGLGNHPFILAARRVQEFSGRLYVEMDYVGPDEQGRVSLDDHLWFSTGPIDADQSLEWAVQFCRGMEHANDRGIQCHRDIKPSNILIARNGNLKIADFGLAAAAEGGWQARKGRRGSWVSTGSRNGFGASLLETAEGGVCCGTPGYIPPEVYRRNAADVRSDVYSFGLVLWQMAAGKTAPPFHVEILYEGDGRAHVKEYMEKVYELQMAARVPPVDSPLMPMIERCLRPGRSERYGSFAELRGDLERVFAERTGRSVEVPATENACWYWVARGTSYQSLGDLAEAIRCYDKALELDPREWRAWNNKGDTLRSQHRYLKALKCFNKSLEINPRNECAWCNKGVVFGTFWFHRRAIECYDKALEIDPQNRNAWYNKATDLDAMGRYEESIPCYDRALEIDPGYSDAWNNKAASLLKQRRFRDAVECCDRALESNPFNRRAQLNRAEAEKHLRRGW